MAATVTGTFRLIDRASGPLARIEAQAANTDVALAALGDTMDSIGTSNQLGQLDDVNKQLQQNERQAKSSSGAMDQMSGATDAVAASSGRAAGRMGRMARVALLLGGAFAALLPIVIDLSGALGALIGSLGAALKGAGALAVGLGGALVTGLVGVAAAGLAASNRIKNLKDEFKDLRDNFRELTRPGQDDFMSTLRDVLERTNKMLPMFARSANRSMAAASDAITLFMNRLDSPAFERFISRMTLSFERIAGPIAKAIADIGETLGNIAVASAPMVERMMRSFSSITGDWVAATSNTSALRRSLGAAVSQTRDWFRLFAGIWDLTKAVFGSGADEGQGLVRDMTARIAEYTEFVTGNPEAMDNFWRESIEGTKELARLFSSLIGPLRNVNDAMEPLVKSFERITTAIANFRIPGTEISGLTALLGAFGGYRLGKRFGMFGGGVGGGISGMFGSSNPGSATNPIAVTQLGGVGGPGVMPTPTRGRPGAPGNPGRVPPTQRPLPIPGLPGGGVLGRVGGALGKVFAPLLKFSQTPVGKIVKWTALIDLFVNLGENNVPNALYKTADFFAFGLLPGGDRSPFTNTSEKDRIRDRQRGRAQRGEFVSDSQRALAQGTPFRNAAQANEATGRTTAEILRQQNLTSVTNERAIVLQARIQEQLRDAIQWADRRQTSRQDNRTRRTTSGELSRTDLPDTRTRRATSGTQDWDAYMKASDAAQAEVQRRSEAKQKRLRESFRKNNVGIRTDTKEVWKNIADVQINQSDRAMREVLTNAAQMYQRTFQQLTNEYGMSGKEAKDALKGVKVPVKTGKDKALGGRVEGYAGGGRIRGQGKRDTVPITMGMAAPGELIVNRHTEGRVNNMLGMFGTSLDGEVGRENVPHSGTPKPGHRRRPKTDAYYARGGRVAYPDADGALPGLDALAYFLKQKFGLSVTSGIRPGDITSSGNPSDHGWGGAIDVSNGVTTPQMDAAHAWLQANFSGAIKQMLYRTMIGGNHFDHIHVALNEAYARNPAAVARLAKGAGGVMLPSGPGMKQQMIKLKRRMSNVGGFLGAMSTRAMGAQTAGMERMLNKRGGAMVGPAGGGRLVGASVYGGARDATSGTEGYKGDQLPGTMTYAELGYSGGDASSANLLGGLPYKAPLRISYGGKSVVARKRDIGAGGGDVQGQPRAIDLWHETAAALGFPFGVGLVKVQKMAHGGRTPKFGGWYGNGGKFTADQPTLIGVGESGREEVTVKPANKGTASSGGGISIGNINIENHRKGDIKKQIKQELQQAFNELSDEIGTDTGTGIV
jgi:hypothetical protein